MNALKRFFHNKHKLYKGEVVDLRERFFLTEKMALDGVATVLFDIYKHDTNTRVGTIDLRMTVEGDMYYYGHIGYSINKQSRGHGYAYEACKVLFEIAKKEYKMDEIIITCSPENIASYKTLQKLDGELIEVVDVPESHPLYKRGETQKYIFKYKIKL